MIKKDIGFVLKRFNFGETSTIATLYLHNFGKIRGIFKGFYRQKKEFSTSLDIFSLNEFIFYPKESEIWLVSQADLIAEFSYLKDSLEKAAVAGFFFKLLDKTMQLWDKNRYIFNLVFHCMRLIEKDYTKAFYLFLIKFLTLAGIKPELNHCIICQKLIKGPRFFSTRRGGLLCFECCKNYKDYKSISKETSKAFNYIQNNSIAVASRLQLSSHCQKEIAEIIEKFLAYHFDLGNLFQRSLLFPHPLASKFVSSL
ncbi:MAG: DNA repair protein RecO [Candidatus Omnitrophica bacterium]|nr:DNA repair protein RecO [Candidatus Omnitrophota bacterium]MCF7894158.1 DNA repair protein RecO [Candidatus Omnitrophota bacterium]